MRIPELQALIVLPLATIIFLVRVGTGHAPRWLRERQPARRRPQRPQVITQTIKTAASAAIVGALP